MGYERFRFVKNTLATDTVSLRFSRYLELVNSIAFDPEFQATRLLHPATYINKIIVASSQGGVQLWNISTGCGSRTAHSDELPSLMISY